MEIISVIAIIVAITTAIASLHLNRVKLFGGCIESDCRQKKKALSESDMPKIKELAKDISEGNTEDIVKDIVELLPKIMGDDEEEPSKITSNIVDAVSRVSSSVV